MAFTVNWTDVATLWGGRRAQWNKGQHATQESLSAIKDRLPFAMLGAHPDTGSEFINWYLKGWCDEQAVEMTRSRPYHKDDNAYVEQKNGHIVRRFLGYSRLDNKTVIPLMNDLYETLDVYLNHFVPSRKCFKVVDLIHTT
jgi:transposase InsO family protein